MERFIVYKNKQPRDSETSWQKAINSFKNLRYQTSHKIALEAAKLVKAKEDEAKTIKAYNANLEAERAEQTLQAIEQKKQDQIALVANVMRVTMEATSHLSKDDAAKIAAALILSLSEK
jgi:hypothetical protein